MQAAIPWACPRQAGLSRGVSSSPGVIIAALPASLPRKSSSRSHEKCDDGAAGPSSSSPRECGGDPGAWKERCCVGRPVGIPTGMHQVWAQQDSRAVCAGTRGTVFRRAGKREWTRSERRHTGGDPGRGARRNWRQCDAPCFMLRSVLGTETRVAVQPLGRRVSRRLRSTPSDVPSASPGTRHSLMLSRRNAGWCLPLRERRKP